LILIIQRDLLDDPREEVWESLARVEILVTSEFDFSLLLVQDEFGVGIAPSLLIEVVQLSFDMWLVIDDFLILTTVDLNEFLV